MFGWSFSDGNSNFFSVIFSKERAHPILVARYKEPPWYRTLLLSADAISVLKMQKCKVGNSEWVFPSPSGGPMSPDSVLHMPQRVLKRAGLPRIRFHDLRHPYVKSTTKKYEDFFQLLKAS
ncbi:MAG: tyrosine-type recombinase/integrase [Eubacteriales bacterium]